MGRTSKDKRDIFYRLAKQKGYRARSAFKLIQIDDKFALIDSSVTHAVDLCAAPGSWSQVLWERMRQHHDHPCIVAVDLQLMAPLEGVTQLQADITDSEGTATRLLERLGGHLSQLVVCDGAPDVTGLHDLDEFIQSQLIVAAVRICAHVLDFEGTFVAKIFRGRDVHVLCARLEPLFTEVLLAKPASSRASSIESFLVCRGFRRPPVSSLQCLGDCVDTQADTRQHTRFFTCGDLSGYDAETTYSLDEEYRYTEIVQPPIQPTYQTALHLRKSNNLAKPLEENHHC